MNDDQPKNKVPIKALLLGILAATAFVIAFWQAPWWFDSLHIRKTKLEPADGVIITGVRTGLVAFAAGVIAGVGLYYTHKKHNLEQLQFAHARQQFAESQQQFATTLQESQERDTRQAELAREGQVTGRYVEAVKLLGSDNLHQRLGGIYALERVMNDSDRDHRTIVEVLSAFVRTNLQAAVTMQEPQHPNSSSAQPKATSADGLFILSEDTKAALTVLGRRDAGEGTAVSAELAGVQLARYDLVGAKWPRLQLARASLADANLRSADLNGVRLDNADLNRAVLTRASLRSASLESAALTSSDLVGADLTDARFDRAVMLNAIMNKAILTGATLAHADLSGATLNEAQFERANLTRVRLVGARLADTNFHGANLTHADLSHASLRRAILDGARLHYTDFDGADLRETKLDKATGLEAGKLIKARIDHTTSLPSHLSEDPAVQVCIADWEAAADEEAEARVPDVDWEPGRQEM